MMIKRFLSKKKRKQRYTPSGLMKRCGACLRENKYNEGIMGLVVTVF